MLIKGILAVLAVIFAIMGICETIHTVRLLFLSPSEKSGIYSVLMLKPETALHQVSFAKEQLNWLGCDYAEKVFAVTDGISPQELSACRNAVQSDSIVFLSLDELSCEIKNQRK